MRISTAKAKKILGIEKDLSPKELSILYSNLVRDARDINEVVIISTAYILLQQDSARLNSDLDIVFHINEELKNYFSQARKEYFAYTGGIKSNLKYTIERMIDNTRQTDELREVVKKDVANELQYSTTNLSLYLRGLDERITMDERYSLVRIFYPLYKERQAKWLRRFYASRIFQIEIVFLVLTTTITYIFSFLNIIPGLTKYLSTNFPDVVPFLSILSSQVSLYFWEILTGISGILFLGMVIRYWQLGPDHQLITPRLSAQGIRELVGEEAGKIKLSDLDLTKRGGMAVLATFAFDPTFVLPTIAAVITAVIYFLSSSFREQKQKAKEQIGEKINLGFNEVDHSVTQWFTTSEQIARHAMRKSVIENCKRLSGDLIRFKPKRFYRQAA